MTKETDRLSQALLRRHGIGVRQKRIHFRGRDLLFQLRNARYDVFNGDRCIATVETNNIHDAIKQFKALDTPVEK
ncbi:MULTISPECIES: hypothetical protein [Pantoea]|jgi:ATP-dependent exoDNAse (exonuclease V) alpha subunit|uniref:DUF4222 domain-containing protein n=1 Tax=Pantoea anthophila TaxID=470931 RepID=A0ABY2ZM40_9GAMM|nr:MULTISPECIES: hypothetical protein [Pantoea]KAF6660233.1 hypothetical protein HFD91_09315 [Enterobacteriaceae bacterium EKM102V]TPE14841.1 hypothetical protein FJP62_13975 [Pantoea vagans]DAL43687.1 MAG TPA_asm: hypothetical protein [Caudoviricetes sp.]EIB96613.1 hypothetical protein S7A_18549 [Pantoea sp. Sc1]KAA5974411.1 hypothetical protein F3I51_06700 [Pantoea sp. M_6]